MIGPMAEQAGTREIHLHDPHTLYRHWEEQQWSPWDTDLSTDRGQWPAMTGDERSVDEARHMQFYARFQDEVISYPAAIAEHVARARAQLSPAVAESLTPPDREGTDWVALGASADEIRAFALDGLGRRLNIVGVPLTSL
jgi:hypothetical protein